MKFALLSYAGTNNLGDEIQSIAARRFLPRVDTLVDRESLSSFLPEDGAVRSIILNGWFMHRPHRWPPTPFLRPLFVSFHLSRGPHWNAKDSFGPAGIMLSPGVREYLVEQGPIGARDYATLALLQEHGVDAYFSGCLTLTLIPQSAGERRDYVCAVDVSDAVIARIQQRHKSPIVRLSHTDSLTIDASERFLSAERLLDVYEKAACVVTTRLHCALPCLALGTPVLFLDDQPDTYRFEGLRELVNSGTSQLFLDGRVDYDFERPPPNPDKHLPLRAGLIEACQRFVEDGEAASQICDESAAGNSSPTFMAFLTRHQAAVDAALLAHELDLGAEASRRQELAEQLRKCEQRLQEAENGLQSCEQERATLQRVASEADAAARRITESRAWRWVQRYYKLYDLRVTGRVLHPLRGVLAFFRRYFTRFRFILTDAARMVVRRYLPARLRTALRHRLLRVRPASPPIIQARAQPPAEGVLVSVIVPCFNYGAFVTQAIQSVLRQTLQDFEIIVVDDGSTDPETKRVLDGLSIPRVRLFRQDNAGLPEARNAGIRLAVGKYVCCLDADDQLEPTYLEKCVSILESNPGFGIAYSWLRLCGDDTGIWETADLDLERLLFTNHIIVSAVYRRADWARAGGYSSEMRGGYEDWEYWLRLAALGIRGKSIPEPLFLHYRHGRTMTHRANEIAAELTARMRDRNRRVFEDSRFRDAIRRTYRDVQLDLPFRGLGQAEQFRAPAHQSVLLMLLPWLDVGGAETMLLDLARGLARKRSLLVVTTHRHDNPMTEEFAAHAEAVYHLPNFLAERDWKAFLRNLVVTRRVTTALVSGSELGYEVAGDLRNARPGLKVVNLMHNDSELGHLGSALEHDKDIDVHIGVAARIATTLTQKGIAAQKCATIANGVDLGLFRVPDAPARLVARGRFGLSEDEIVCLFVGRFSVEKRPEVFCELAEQLSGRDGLRFLMVGDGPLRGELTARYSKVLFAGSKPRSEMPLVYAAADLLVITSSVEGLPMTMLEALAAGVPVIATGAGDISAVIQEGTNGYTVPVSRPMLLKGLIQNLAGSPQQLAQLKEAARSSIVGQGLSLAAMCQGYEALLDRLEAAGASVPH